MTRTARMFAVPAAVLFALFVFSVGKCVLHNPNAVRIGSKNFTEQIIVAEMVAQLIEHRLQLPVERKFNLGGTFVCFNALRSGQLHLYVEYTGTGYTTILKMKARTPDRSRVYGQVAEVFRRKWSLIWLKPLGFNNTYALAMRSDRARAFGVRTVSDLGRHAHTLTPGFNHEFLERPDGYPGLARHYGFSFAKRPKELDPGLLYRAAAQGDVDVISAFSTDGRIKAFGLTTLVDDKRFFPPYEAAVLARSDVLRKHPRLGPLLAELAGRLTDRNMMEMNYLVDARGQSPAQVAASFLKRTGLIGRNRPRDMQQGVTGK